MYYSTQYRKRIFEMCIFSMLGTLMFCSKIMMEFLPNVHLLGMLTMLYTLLFRVKALIPIYIYVLLNGIYAGFSMWWIPYLYIWTVLWAITMLLPKKMPYKISAMVYPVVCALHGFLFGILYSPAEAVMYKMSFEQTVAWLIIGIPYDIIHTAGNFVAGLLILPLYHSMDKLMKRIK